MTMMKKKGHCILQELKAMTKCNDEDADDFFSSSPASIVFIHSHASIVYLVIISTESSHT